MEHGTDIFVRAAPLWPAVAAAAAETPTSSTTGEVWPPTGAPVRRGWWPGSTNWAHYATDSTPDRATDLVVVLFGHDVFRSLVSEAGWSVPAYKAWLFTTLVQQLLRRPRLAPTAFADLSYAPLLART